MLAVGFTCLCRHEIWGGVNVLMMLVINLVEILAISVGLPNRIKGVNILYMYVQAHAHIQTYIHISYLPRLNTSPACIGSFGLRWCRSVFVGTGFV